MSWNIGCGKFSDQKPKIYKQKGRLCHHPRQRTPQSSRMWMALFKINTNNKKIDCFLPHLYLGFFFSRLMSFSSSKKLLAQQQLLKDAVSYLLPRDPFFHLTLASFSNICFSSEQGFKQI